MLLLNAQSMGTVYLMSSSFGVNGLFYLLAAIQIAAFLIFSVFLKETKGLDESAKKELYLPKEERERLEAQEEQVVV